MRRESKVEGWKIVSTLDGREPEADLYGVERRIFTRLRDAQEMLDKLRVRAQRMEWEYEPPEYRAEPVNISRLVVSPGTQ
jgi:hypothetical protein